ncbi:unnamed protein product [Bursaphelenchus xylophilus]|uniref:(pine wood nematode) hypothetical protein n=1 Tax=Bursaphelenchus xylophilus TaxID=6326 RepID=A0A1I7SW22_BURXY|nr:unnamed protein product [Bursaphelenchus xylophilus]CAG9098690.1 unnamed protein product [Bursaphelenchus xylophilus]
MSTSIDDLRAQIKKAEELKTKLMEERRNELQQSLKTLKEYLKLLTQAEKVYEFDEEKKIWLADIKADVHSKLEKRLVTQQELVEWFTTARYHEEHPYTVKVDGCSICLTSTPTEPKICMYCLSVIGCKECVDQWNEHKKSNDYLPSCPKCRNYWALEPAVLDY